MTADEILNARDHRPFPAPERPWVMRQEWHDLLFAHWAFDPGLIRPLVPAQLPLDLWRGQAYLAVAPFVVRGLRPRGMPSLAGISNFPEVNVRTYVTVEDKPGVYFFSLDAGNLSAVVGARVAYRLPYYLARMRIANSLPETPAYHPNTRKLRVSGAPVVGRVVYSSRRVAWKNRPENPELRITYSPCGDVLPWEQPSRAVERFLTERYCLYTVRAGRIYRANIHHVPWPLQPATAEIEKNTIAAPLGLRLEGKPLLHFSRFLDVLVWSPVRAG